MSWLNRISVQDSREMHESSQSEEERMGPGLTGEYDWSLREKAGQHSPPAPPECMGVEGEYDPSGLAKRIAIALDEDPMIHDIETLEIIQMGRAIALKGQLEDSAVLDRIVQIVSQVDGTNQVDTHEVAIHN